MIDSKISTTEAIFMIVTVIVAHTLSSLPQNLINNTKSSTIINLIYVGVIAILISYIIYIAIHLRIGICNILLF